MSATLTTRVSFDGANGLFPDGSLFPIPLVICSA